MRLIPILLSAALVAGAACAKRSRSEPQLTPLPTRPLASLAGQDVIVLPVRYLRPGDSLGWAQQVAAPRDFLRGLDDEVTRALSARGLTGWVFASRVVSSARRNAAFAPDPYALAAESLRPGARRPAQIAEPLASQLRSLVALHEGRYALYPIEVRFERVPGASATSGRAVMHVALIDARLAQVVLARDVTSDTAAAPTAALAADLAEKLADLIASP